MAWAQSFFRIREHLSPESTGLSVLAPITADGSRAPFPRTHFRECSADVWDAAEHCAPPRGRGHGGAGQPQSAAGRLSLEMRAFGANTNVSASGPRTKKMINRLISLN